MTRHTKTLRTPLALAAVGILLAACSDGDADATDTADDGPSSRTPAAEESSAPTEENTLPAGVLPLPAPAPDAESATLVAGRYRVPLGDTLAFDIDLPEGTVAYDDGLFLATEDFVVKTEVAGEDYGVPRDPCASPTIDAVGPTVEDLLGAIADLPVYETTPPEPVELGGAEGAYVEARVPRGYDASKCAGKAVQLPGNPETTVSGPPPYIGRWWVLEVEGQRVVVQQNCWGCRPDQFDRGPMTPQSITFTPTS
jgi:hypothetical protein